MLSGSTKVLGGQLCFRPGLPDFKVDASKFEAGGGRFRVDRAGFEVGEVGFEVVELVDLNQLPNFLKEIFN